MSLKPSMMRMSMRVYLEQQPEIFAGSTEEN